MNRQRGFTLLEMIIAVVIFAVISMITFTGLSQMIKIGDQVGASNERLSQIQFALAYFHKDWLQVTKRNIRDDFGDSKNHIELEENRISWTRGGWNNLLGAQRSELQRVEYVVQDQQLVRRAWTTLDRAVDSKPIETRLLANVKDLKVEFMVSANDSVTAWPNPLTTQGGQPRALRIALDIDGMGQIHRIFEVPNGVI